MTHRHRRRLQGAIFKQFNQAHMLLASTMLVTIASSAYGPSAESIGRFSPTRASSIRL